MTPSESKKHGFDALFIIDIVLKYKKHLAIVGVVSVILGIIFSTEYFIKPRFKSTAIVYPSNLVPYSTESPTEQLLQLFESDDIRDNLIKDFNLYEHYQIDTNQKYPLTLLHGQMKENIQVDKTKFESIEITVWDTDPQIASDIADSLISKMDHKARQLQRAKAKEVVVIIKNQLDLKKAEMDSMEIGLKNLRTEYGILDFSDQIKAFSKVYYSEMVSGRVGTGRPIDKVMSNLQNKGGEYVTLSEHLWRTRGTYNDFKIQYESALKDLTKELTYSNIITKPIPAEKKSYPIRSLLILMFTSSMLLLSFIVIVVYENSLRLEHNKTI
jgi:capsular polysaccharide biosynthesis protein